MSHFYFNFVCEVLSKATQVCLGKFCLMASQHAICNQHKTGESQPDVTRCAFMALQSWQNVMVTEYSIWSRSFSLTKSQVSKISGKYSVVYTIMEAGLSYGVTANTNYPSHNVYQ